MPLFVTHFVQIRMKSSGLISLKPVQFSSFFAVSFCFLSSLPYLISGTFLMLLLRIQTLILSCVRGILSFPIELDPPSNSYPIFNVNFSPVSLHNRAAPSSVTPSDLISSRRSPRLMHKEGPFPSDSSLRISLVSNDRYWIPLVCDVALATP